MNTYTTTWLSPKQMPRQLRKIAKNWPNPDPTGGMSRTSANRRTDANPSASIGLDLSLGQERGDGSRRSTPSQSKLKTRLESTLAPILYEVWSATQHTVPFPYVCVLYEQENPIGVLCGQPSHDQGSFFIQHLAIRSDLNSEQIAQDVRQQLVDAAIDCSQEHGFHGWVSCAPKAEETPDWNSLGFSRHPNFLTLRRMGYFTHL